MKEHETGIGVTVRLGEVALTFEVKKANPLDPPIKIEVQKPIKCIAYNAKEGKKNHV